MGAFFVTLGPMSKSWRSAVTFLPTNPGCVSYSLDTHSPLGSYFPNGLYHHIDVTLASVLHTITTQLSIYKG